MLCAQALAAMSPQRVTQKNEREVLGIVEKRKEADSWPVKRNRVKLFNDDSELKRL